MSCRFPVNIDTDATLQNCNMYCDYKYDYNDSSCVVTNMGSMLKIKYDLKSDGTVPQAFLNKKKFNVSEIQIFQPSRNTYKGIRADIEFVIVHEGDNNTQLLVSMPFAVSTTAPASSSASSSKIKPGSIVLDNIINEFTRQTAGRAPNPSEQYQITVNNFNLNNFIPNTPYYFYNVNKRVETTTCNQSNIAFDLLKSGQTISKTAIDKLNSILTANRVTGLYPPIDTQIILYVNSKGPNYQGTVTDDKIYIDCQPTGNEGKELYKETTDIGAESRQQGIALLNKLMNSGSVQFILAIVVGMVVLGIGKRAFTRS